MDDNGIKYIGHSLSFIVMVHGIILRYLWIHLFIYFFSFISSFGYEKYGSVTIVNTKKSNDDLNLINLF